MTKRYRPGKRTREQAIELLLICAWSPERDYLVDAERAIGADVRSSHLAQRAFRYVDDARNEIRSRQSAYAEAAAILMDGWTP